MTPLRRTLSPQDERRFLDSVNWFENINEEKIVCWYMFNTHQYKTRDMRMFLKF